MHKTSLCLPCTCRSHYFLIVMKSLHLSVYIIFLWNLSAKLEAKIISAVLRRCLRICNEFMDLSFFGSCWLVVLVYQAAPFVKPVKFKLSSLFVIGTWFEEGVLLPLILQILISAHRIGLFLSTSACRLPGCLYRCLLYKIYGGCGGFHHYLVDNMRHLWTWLLHLCGFGSTRLFERDMFLIWL
jgi:hypothetical protein